MKANPTDKDLDIYLRKLVENAGADDSTIEEAATSSTAWWGVQRQIRNEETERSVPGFDIRKWLLFAVPATAAVLLLVSFAIFIYREPAVEQAAIVAPSEPANVQQPVEGESEEDMVESYTKGPKPISIARRLRQRTQKRSQPARQKQLVIAPKEEIRTEFIALSYARDPESGQIVRLKVPRSMMVTVGLVASVDKPAALVDAEVIVGDDGLTRAIRFIR